MPKPICRKTNGDHGDGDDGDGDDHDGGDRGGDARDGDDHDGDESLPRKLLSVEPHEDWKQECAQEEHHKRLGSGDRGYDGRDGDDDDVRRRSWGRDPLLV